MATKANERNELLEGGPNVDPEHDAVVRAKVERGLAQSRDRSSLTPIEQVWRDRAR